MVGAIAADSVHDLLIVIFRQTAGKLTGATGVIQPHINVAQGVGEGEGDRNGMVSLDIHGEPVVVISADLEIGISA